MHILIKYTNNISMESILEKKKQNSIFNFWNIAIFFLIYSICGYFLETIFGIITKGVLESRQSFLFGPFCAIYGIGGTLMILFLSKLKDKPILLFLSSAIIRNSI